MLSQAQLLDYQICRSNILNKQTPLPTSQRDNHRSKILCRRQLQKDNQLFHSNFLHELQNNPDLTAMIMDYEQVKPYAEEKFTELKLENRASFYDGDIFKDELPIGDVSASGFFVIVPFTAEVLTGA